MRPASATTSNPWAVWLFSTILCLASVPCALAQTVDLNTADAATLSRVLVGIGESRARAIVEHRQRRGPFGSVDELALVRGIGPKTVERNRARMRVSAPSGAVPRPEGAAAGSSARVVGPRPPRPSSRPGVRPDDEPPEILVAD